MMTPQEISRDHDAFLRAVEAVEWAPESIVRRATMPEIFEREAPLQMDVGCGDGAFLLEMALRHPEWNFLGTERLLGRVEKVCRMIARHRLTNARVIRLESLYVMQHLVPLGSVGVVHVSCPDPWPKRQHHPRRLIQDVFMQAVHAALEPGGELRLKTDDLPYFMWMEKVIARAQGFERIEWPDDPAYPITDFEKKFLAQGLPIHRARLRKV